MEGLKNGALEIAVSRSGAKTVHTWLGQSDARNPATFLDPYFKGIIGGLKGSELLVDFSKLQYMNSSTVSPIIQFLKQLDTNGVRTMIVYDAKSTWQNASFRALEAISLAMKNITVKPK